MRYGFPALLLALSPCLVVTTADAADNNLSSVSAINDALLNKKTELQDAQTKTQTQKDAYQVKQEALRQLEKKANELSQQLKAAKVALDKSYDSMLTSPDTDISSVKAEYQQAWAKVKANQTARLNAQQALDEQKTTLEQQQQHVELLTRAVNELNIEKRQARAQRLQRELSQTHEQKISFTNRCSNTMTIAQCAEQTKELGLQKAVNQYQQWLLSNATESKLIKQHADSASLNIHLLKHRMLKSGFNNNNQYQSVILAKLEARPDDVVACQLLSLNKSDCVDPQKAAQKQKNKEVAWVSLTVHSNKYHDHIKVDDVNYGSTPTDIMLPVGKHEITVTKEGYHDFTKTVNIRSNYTFRAVLKEQANILKAGHKFADSLKGGVKAPEMITMIRGEYLIGEHASHKISLDHAFALGATPVTVGQFATFINQTNYQTDAELTHLCIAVHDTEITPISDSYWRNPGFKQTATHPVTCVSQNDAKAYAAWLSKQTGFTYRLPTPNEWEIAARSGSQSDYPWGDDFGADNANTGWSGSQWSNKSTSPVKSFDANNLGFYDVIGNVWEWTNDERGMARGGAWSFSPSAAKADNHLFIAPDTAANYVGFRVVREIHK